MCIARAWDSDERKGVCRDIGEQENCVSFCRGPDYSGSRVAAVGWGLYLVGGRLIRLQQSTLVREKFVNRGCAHGNRCSETGFGEHWRGDSGGR